MIERRSIILPGVSLFISVSSSISTNINITVASVVERINSQKKKQGYNSPDGSGIRFCGLRLEKPDGTLVHQQRDSAVSLQSSAWVNTTISFNHTLNTNTDGTSFVLRHTADIFRNDESLPIKDPERAYLSSLVIKFAVPSAVNKAI